MSHPDTLPGQLLTALLGPGATGPRLTWYGVDGERTELSGRVLGNWVTKAANLLVEEADAGPGTVVVLDLPVHWRTLVWALGSWVAGAQVTLPSEDLLDEDEDADAPDVVVTSRPGESPGEDDAELVLAVALPALAMRWDGDPLGASVVDAAAELMTFGDQLGYVSEPESTDLALVNENLEVTYGDLAGWATGAAEEDDIDADDVDLEPGYEDELDTVDRPDDDAAVVPAEEDDIDADERPSAAPVRALLAPDDVADLLEQAVRTWHGGGSVVLVEPGLPADVRRRVAEDERVDSRL